MENQTERIYKSKKCVREAVKRFKQNMKENDPEKYQEYIELHRAYNREYHQIVKTERAQLKVLLSYHFWTGTVPSGYLTKPTKWTFNY